jgi:phosphoenolpyruvate carboxykinase (ATP)
MMTAASDLNDLILIKFQNKPKSNLEPKTLLQYAVQNREGVLTADGVLAVTTGAHTGRSPKDKFIVRDALTVDQVGWQNNSELSKESFDLLFEDMLAHASAKLLFVQDLAAGADPQNRIDVKVITEFAWHSLFIRNLLIRTDAKEHKSFDTNLTIINLPSFKANPSRHSCRSETIIAFDFTRRIVLIAGTEYAGEMKKAVFTYLNFILPAKGVFPMHCAANVDKDGNAALFFGLSGTGKTTLSADPLRTLIGDDEHGWSDDGIFNFEGGCYAKTIRLSAENEPEIFSATKRSGAVLENVVVDTRTGKPDFDNVSLTENGRIAYPIDFISNASSTSRASHPKNVVLLTCDAFGVLPPIARLNVDQAVDQFLAGYTSKVAGTERGIKEPQATFSACFGAPFMPRDPKVYGNLLRRLIQLHSATCWLLNTGWTGGPYGVGQRMPLRTTRLLLAAALDGSLDHASFRTDPVFGFEVPKTLPGITPALLKPRNSWASATDYDIAAQKLLNLFDQNGVGITVSNRME